MDRKLIYILSVAALMLLSCKEKDLEGRGQLGVQVQRDERVEVKSIDPAPEDMAFSVSVYKGSELIVGTDDHRSLIDQPFTLDAGSYSLVAQSAGEMAQAAFDAPFYAGGTNVAVLANRSVTAEVTVSLSNLMVQAFFDQEIADRFTTYSVTVENGAGASLVFGSQEGTLGNTGYFTPDGILRWTLNLENDDVTYSDSGVIENVAARSLYKLTFEVDHSDEDNGYGAFRLIVDDSMQMIAYNIVVNEEVLPEPQTEITSISPWAMFAVVNARWKSEEQPDNLSFAYRLSGSETWIGIPSSAVQVDASNATFSTVIKGLSPLSNYQIVARCDDGAEPEISTFTTDGTPTIYNMGFDEWYKDGDAWYPYAQNAAVPTWDTANGGTKTVSIYPTVCEESHLAVSGEGKKAGKLESKSAPLVGLAAGNIYTGKFQKANMSISNPGAELDWGVNFSGRPVALRGFIDYTPANVDKGSHAGMSGKPDIAQIQILLTDWAGPFRISTSSNKFVDFDNDPNIIAYSYLDVNATSGYQEFVLPLTYRNNRTPRYVVIVAAASKYGDFFTGGVGSVLYVDEFSFEYDLNNLTPEQENKVNYR